MSQSPEISTPNQEVSPQRKQPTRRTITIVGCQGTGKTVLLTVLSQRYREYFLPANNQCLLYVGEIWNDLQRGIWPASTRMGSKHDLGFILKRSWSVRTLVHMPDCAGQDMRSIFVDENFDNDTVGICDELRTSSSVVVVVNLRDFIGEADPNARLRNEAFLIGVLRYMKESNVLAKVACVFTEYDQYKETIIQNYGSCDEYIRQTLPNLHNYIQEGSMFRTFLRGFCHSWVSNHSVVGCIFLTIGLFGIILGFVGLAGWFASSIELNIIGTISIIGIIIGGLCGLNIAANENMSGGPVWVTIGVAGLICGLIGWGLGWLFDWLGGMIVGMAGGIDNIVALGISSIILGIIGMIIGSSFYGFLAIRFSRIPIFPVAAVAETELDATVNPPTRIPKAHFTSLGLDELVRWIRG